MTLFNQLSIKNRLILAGIFMAILFFGFGFISINQMNRLGDLTATLYEHPLQVSNAALKAKVGVIRMHRSMKDVSTSTTRLSATLAIQTVLSEEEKVYAELDLIRGLILGKEGKQLVSETTDLFAGWKPIRLEVEELVLLGKHEAANKITRGKGADYVARLERNIAALTAYAIKKADGFMADASDTQTHILNNTLIFNVIMVFSGLGLGFFMSASILSSLSALKQTMTDITVSGELTEARLEGNNEITQMADHFNSLILRLKRQFWLGDGRNALNESLSGELTYDQLLEKSIREVCRYTHACAGAVYRFDRDKNICELKSSYALVDRTHLANRFHMGQGIVGQVALEKKAIHLTQISPKDALGRSATVSKPPNDIYALPLVYQDTLYGVMETASFDPIDPIKQKYLESAAETVAVFLHAASQKDRISQLLDISQEANETLQARSRELQAQTEELTALNKEFHQQSRELKAQNLALEDQRIQVEEANRLKSEFLSNMSHELRTPLNSVNALSRVLRVQAKEKLSEEELDYLAIIEKNGKHLLTLINDILDLSKIEAGRMEIINSEFSLNAMVETILESMAPIALEKGIGLEKDLASDLPRIISDESRVLQILQNIVANAIKFTEKGEVRISTQKKDTCVSIRVRDTGIGISNRDMDSIFEEFRQADGAFTRKFEGSGLGLSIAHKAAKLLGGDIRVESIPDRGTCFEIYLPLKNRRQKPDTGKSNPGNKTATILAVDDDPLSLSTLSAALAQNGYQCITSKSGQRAVELAKTHMPDAITLDILMPDMDGWEVISELKKDPATKDIPVIIVSASQDRATGFAMGAVGYMTKPIGKKALQGELNRLFTTPPTRILVVDDSPLDLKQTSDLIKKEGILVTIADSGAACMEALNHETPDLMILDLAMPEMDGFKILKQIRTNPEIRHLPVVVVTAKDLGPEEKNLLESHVSAILPKKMPPEDLVDEVSKVLGPTGKKNEQKAGIGARTLDGISGSGETAAPGQAPMVLVVEDNLDNMITIKAVLGPVCTVVGACDGKKGLDTAVSVLPDIILLDMSLPVMDGFAVVKHLKSHEKTKDIPVIALTAQAMKGDKIKILAAGCDDYISKPIDPDTVMGTLAKWTALRK